MFVITRRYTRPSTDIMWHTEKSDYILELEEFRNHLFATYVNTEKLLFQETQIENELTMCYTGMWDSKESFDQYDTDTILQKFWTIKDQYNQSVGIITGPKETSER